MNMPHVPEPLLKAQRLAHLLDSAVRIPIVGFRFGIDSLFGLIPVVGDALMFVTSMRIIYLARQLGVPKEMQNAMLRNCILDFGIGFVPFVGDVVDMFYKANNANVKMMEKWWLNSNHQLLQQNTQAALTEWEKEQDS